jgi:hypothetical protein
MKNVGRFLELLQAKTGKILNFFGKNLFRGRNLTLLLFF